MNGFALCTDIEIVMELLDMTARELAESIGVTPTTISRWRKNEEQVSSSNLNAFYNFAFGKGIRLNKIKEQLFKEDCVGNSTILFHGAKTYIDGKISIEKSKNTNDFGKGFYCGESLEQSAMFVANYPGSSLYILEFDKTDLRYTQLNVDRDWMLLIAYFRDKLTDYSAHPIIQNLLARLENVDYIIAPIADNRMFEIIDSFIDGEITDVQCQHCLSATNLGNQYVFVTNKALSQLKILRHCYLAPDEKKYYLSYKREESRIGNDKVKVARRQYRGQGEYIEDVLK
jgi:transcriptional regulator with XRE-family HTH domain